MIDINGYSRYSAFYIPESTDTARFSSEILKNYEEFKNHTEKIEIIRTSKGDLQIGFPHATYTNKIYFYLETELNEKELQALSFLSREKKYFVTIRSKKYVGEQIKSNRPLAFISHDHRDKERIATPLAEGLKKRLCTVWYDEYSLKVGDSLRESIENGIKEAKKCVLIITPHFLNNAGWGKAEFNSIFTRQILFKERIVLPIRFGVSSEEVYNYSPNLADVLALHWPDDSEFSEEKYKKEKEIFISKIHTAIV